MAAEPLARMLRSRWAPVAVVAAFAMLVACAGVFVLPPLDRDESRFAQATAQMLESGDYVTIRFQDAERNKKPAGIHWLQAASVSVFSSPEKREIWAYRIPSVLGVVIAAIMTFLAGSRLFGPHAGFLGALVLAATPLAAGEATIAKTDAALLAAVAAAQCAFIHIFARAREGRPAGLVLPLAFWAALSAGILIKGPIAPMILGLTVAMVGALGRDFSFVRALRPGLGAVLVAAAAAPWLIAVNTATEGRFFSEALGRDMIGKLGAAQESHAGPPGFHLLLAPLLLWPAIAAVPVAVMDAWRDRRAWRSLLIAAWVAPSWIVFELTATKLPHYVLPLYPALCLLAAQAAISNTAHARPVARHIGAVIYATAGMIFAGALIALPMLYGRDEAPALAPMAAGCIIAAASVLIATMFWRGRFLAATYAAAGLSAAFAFALLQITPPFLQRLDLSRSISAALDSAGAHPLRDGAPPAALAGYSEPSAIFLLGTKTSLGDGGAAARHLKAYSGAAAVVESREEAAFLSATKNERIPVRRFGVIDGVNYSNGRTMRLNLYVIAQ